MSQPRRKWVQISLGFIVGVAFWLMVDGLWQRMIAPPAGWLARVTESPSVTRLSVVEEGIMVERSDFSPRSPRPIIRASDMTFNIVLLFALFAIGTTFRDRNVGRFVIALGLLLLMHVLFLFVRVKAIYALQLGAWSLANHGVISRNVWGFLDHFYRVVGMYALAFGLWWWLGDRVDADASASPGGKRRATKRVRKS